MVRRSRIMAGLFLIGLLLPGWAVATPMAGEVTVRAVGDIVIVQAVVRDLAADAVVFTPQVVTRKGEEARAETVWAEVEDSVSGLLLVEFDGDRIRVTVEVSQGQAALYRSRFTAPAP